MMEESDFYEEDGKIVFTEAYHLKRGYCCNSGCRHCPFKQQEVKNQGESNEPN
ncbi:MAG: hypothetical protein IPM34_08645 [Saprospiraceae bacterium]|nr:hypothetical protein [Saprospiraceae bacterium]